MKWITSLLIIFCIFFSPPNPDIKGPTSHYTGYTLNKEAIEKVKSITVLIEVNGYVESWRGSGVLVDRTHVLTCYHVAHTTDQTDEIWVIFYPGYLTARGKMVWQNSTVDLALLEIDVPVNGAPKAEFQDKTWDGEPISIIGNAEGGMRWFTGFGVVSGGGGPYVYTDGPVMGGDSGGPWVNEKGEIVGISDWGLETTKGSTLPISGAISAKEIHTFYKSWKDRNKVEGGVVYSTATTHINVGFVPKP